MLFVNHGRALGGAEHSLLLLLQAVRARGIEANAAVFGKGPLRDRLLALGIPTKDVGLPRWTRWPPGATDFLAGRLEGLRW